MAEQLIFKTADEAKAWIEEDYTNRRYLYNGEFLYEIFTKMAYINNLQPDRITNILKKLHNKNTSLEEMQKLFFALFKTDYSDILNFKKYAKITVPNEEYHKYRKVLEMIFERAD